MADTTDKALDALQQEILGYADGVHDMTPVGATLLQAHQAITALRRERDALHSQRAILALIDTPSYDADVTPEVVAQIRTERGVDVSDPKWVTIDTPSAPSPEAADWRNHSTKTEDGYNG